MGSLGAGEQNPSDDATAHLASGPVGRAGRPGAADTADVGGSLLGRYGPWLGLGAAGLVVLAGAVLALRSRR